MDEVLSKLRGKDNMKWVVIIGGIYFAGFMLMYRMLTRYDVKRFNRIDDRDRETDLVLATTWPLSLPLWFLMVIVPDLLKSVAAMVEYKGDDKR